MKTLRRISAATILSLTLVSSVLAGHIDTPGAPRQASTSTTDVNTSIVLTIIGLIYR